MKISKEIAFRLFKVNKERILSRLRIYRIIKFETFTENDIMSILNNTSEDNSMQMIAVLDTNNIIISTDKTVSLVSKPSSLVLFNKNDEEAVKQLYSKQIIVDVELKVMDKSIMLDMTDYGSVRSIYNVLVAAGISIKSDKELIEYATTKLVPRKRLVITQRKIGKPAFENSKVRQYNLKYCLCNDIDLITSLRVIK